MPIDETAGQFPRIAVTADDRLERDFERQVRACADLAVRVAFGILRQREDAEEIAQEAFAKAYLHRSELREPDCFRAWIVRTTWRLAIDRWRADRRRQAREQLAAPQPDPITAEQLAMHGERSARLWSALDDLPEKLRLVIILCAIEGHGVDEVARLLEIPEGTVKSRLFMARKGLLQRLRCLATDSTRR
jgi:RNA polymerase sigma-70 factor (ECF subfamily)